MTATPGDGADPAGGVATGRARPAQQPPPSASLLRERLPRAEVSPRLYREHGLRQAEADGGCWWFSSSGEGRFDLEEPHGTCYLGESEGVAARERCGRLMAMHLPIPEAIYAGRVVTEVRPPLGLEPVGDLSSPASLTVGVTAELTATSDYALCQTWAQQCWDAGFGSIKYAPRFTPGGREAALAVFGEAGPRPGYGVVHRRSLLEVLREMDYPVIRSDQLGAAALDVQDDVGPK